MACTHGMPTPMSCVECMIDGLPPLPPAPPPPTAGRWFVAKFGGRCACGDPIEPGHLIARMSDGTYRHAEECT